MMVTFLKLVGGWLWKNKIPLIIAAVLLGAALWINNAAYDRGADNVQTKWDKAIADANAEAEKERVRKQADADNAAADFNKGKVARGKKQAKIDERISNDKEVRASCVLSSDRVRLWNDAIDAAYGEKGSQDQP